MPRLILEEEAGQKWCLSLSVCTARQSLHVGQSARVNVSLYYCVRRWAGDRVKADFKSNKLHTEFLFCTLGSSSPDKNEGIFFTVSGQLLCMFGIFFFEWVLSCVCISRATSLIHHLERNSSSIQMFAWRYFRHESLKSRFTYYPETCRCGKLCH